MNQQQQPEEHDEQEILKNILEQQLKDISDNDQSMEAIRNLAAMIALLYTSLMDADVDQDAAVAFTQTYIEGVIHTMLGR